MPVSWTRQLSPRAQSALTPPCSLVSLQKETRVWRGWADLQMGRALGWASNQRAGSSSAIPTYRISNSMVAKALSALITSSEGLGPDSAYGNVFAKQPFSRELGAGGLQKRHF